MLIKTLHRRLDRALLEDHCARGWRFEAKKAFYQGPQVCVRIRWTQLLNCHYRVINSRLTPIFNFHMLLLVNNSEKKQGKNIL